MATALFMRLAGYRLVRKSNAAAAPVHRRRGIKRRAVENCGEQIAQWLDRSAPIAEASEVPKILARR